MSDYDVAKRIDHLAPMTDVGVGFWYEEMTRRHLKRSSRRLERLTWAILALTLANAILVGVSVAMAIS